MEKINLIPNQNNQLISQIKANIGNTISSQKSEIKNETKIPPVVIESSKSVPADTQKLKKEQEPQFNHVWNNVAKPVLKEVSKANLKSIAGPEIFSDEAFAVLASTQFVNQVADYKIEENKDNNSGEVHQGADTYRKSRDAASEALGNLVNTKI